MKTNRFAIASLVAAILWLGGLGSVIAVILGFIGTGQVEREHGRQGGKGLAVAGIVLGFLGLLSTVAVALVLTADLGTLEGPIDPSEDKNAQAALRIALVGAKVLFTDHEDFRDATVQAMAEVDPTLRFLPAGEVSTGPTVVSSGATDASSFVAAVRSESGTCWFIRDRVAPEGETDASVGTRWNTAPSSAPCSAAAAPSSGWTRQPVAPGG